MSSVVIAGDTSGAITLQAPAAPTKEQLMAELAALTAKIQAL